jgi:hypothetical protein
MFHRSGGFQVSDHLRGKVKLAGTITSAQTRQRVTDTIQTLLDAGVQAGSLRADVRADDFAASLVGVFLATPDPAQSDQARPDARPPCGRNPVPLTTRLPRKYRQAA